MNWNGFEGRGEDEGGRRRGRGARPGGWQNVDLPPADDAQSWFEGRLPDGWFSAVDVTVDREEITVVGTLADQTADDAATQGRISRFREETRDARMTIADEAQARYGRKVSWGVRLGGTAALFTNVSVPGDDPAAPAGAPGARHPRRRRASPGPARRRCPGRSSSSASTPRAGWPTCAPRWKRSTSCVRRAPTSSRPAPLPQETREPSRRWWEGSRVPRPFTQVDVFTDELGYGNPVAVVHDAEGLDDAALQRFAAWTNLSETTFLLPPTDPAADYRVRIFTTARELPFAGHPTLGSARAWLEAGGVPADRTSSCRSAGSGWSASGATATRLAFAAPPLLRGGDRSTLLDLAEIAEALRIDPAERGRRPVGRQRAGLGHGAARQRGGRARARAGRRPDDAVHRHRRGRPAPGGRARSRTRSARSGRPGRARTRSPAASTPPWASG